MGRTHSPAPLVEITEREGQPAAQPDGAASPDGRVFGLYLHGLFDNDNFRGAWLASLGAQTAGGSFRQQQALAFDRLADSVEAALDMNKVDALAGL
jgi:adenosylcobyric acid synthase